MGHTAPVAGGDPDDVSGSGAGAAAATRPRWRRARGAAVPDAGDPSLAAQMALVAGILYGSAGLLVLVSLVAAWHAHARPGLAAVIAAVGLVIGCAHVVASREFPPPPWVHLPSAALGSVLVGVLVIAGGATFAAAYGLLLLYVIAFSLYYFSSAVGLAQVVVAAVAYAAALTQVAPAAPRLPYWVMVVGAAVIGSGFVGVLGHRTRLLLAREHGVAERLGELDRRKDDFLRVVAHDLRSPLMSIIGTGETIASHLDDLEPDTVRELSRRQAQQGRNLDRIVRDLLDVERLRTRALHPSLEQVRLDDLVERCLATSEPLDRPVRVEAEPGTVRADPALLERVVDNLLTNALRHTPAGSPVDLRVEVLGDEVSLAVEDRGPGVPEDRREEIFELFSPKVDGATGSGVGLALVREIVTALDGRVTVEDRPGGGARFRVVLPAAGG